MNMKRKCEGKWKAGMRNRNEGREARKEMKCFHHTFMKRISTFAISQHHIAPLLAPLYLHHKGVPLLCCVQN